MSLLTHRRAFLPACLTLGTLLCALPALANAPVARSVPAVQAKTLTLQNVVPKDVLKALHWDKNAQRFDSTAPIRVEGVARISALPANNSLSIVATPDGFTRLRTLIRLLDVAPRQVQINFATATATESDLKASGINFDLVPAPDLGRAAFLQYMTGKGAATLLQALTKQGAMTEGPSITTTNNVNASVKLTTPLGPQQASSATFAVTPRISSGDSVILDLHPVFQEGTVKREIKTLRTVKSGDTLVIVMPPTVAGKGLLLFATPTILGIDNKGQAMMTVK